MSTATTHLDRALHKGLEQELLDVWRRNFVRVGWVLVAWFILRLLYRVAMIVDALQGNSRIGLLGVLLLGALTGAQLATCIRYCRLAVRVESRIAGVLLHRQTLAIIVGLGGLAAAVTAIGRGATGDDAAFAAYRIVFAAMWYMLLSATLVPWNAREGFVTLCLCLAVAIAMAGATGAAELLRGSLWRRTALDTLAGDVLAPLIAVIVVPGAMLAFATTGLNRMRERLEVKVLRHLHQARRESLVDARRIHESRFPPPLVEGPLRVHYAYEPMRQIGGDFLQIHRAPDGGVHVNVIDVTGHGIAAALSVNRIDGELRRLYAEKPEASPVDIMVGLNQYLNLTLARHGVFATGISAHVALDGRITYVNAGHPCAFLRRSDGHLTRLPSTTFILGVCPGDLFECANEQALLAAGESLVLYTDGACESMDSRGRQFGIEGLARAIEAWKPDEHLALNQFLPEAIRRFRHGPPKDDVLIVTVQRA